MAAIWRALNPADNKDHRMDDDGEDRNSFAQQLALAVIPAFIAILPDLLLALRDTQPEVDPSTMDPDSFQAYVSYRRTRKDGRCDHCKGLV